MFCSLHLIVIVIVTVRIARIIVVTVYNSSNNIIHCREIPGGAALQILNDPISGSHSGR